MKKRPDENLGGMLASLQKTGRLPMHMPGHKRNDVRFPHLSALSAAQDITEIDGFDNLHDAEGVLADSMERAAALWGADRSFYLVNGSSGGVLAGIRAMTRRGDAVLVTRAAHKSVYHAMELCGLRPVFLQPPEAKACGFLGSVSPDAVSAALQEHPEVRLVILTSPTYEGVISDIAAIAKITRAAGIPLFVDEAHGAHLSLSPAFPGGAVSAGADVVVQSLHKTLPSLTQTAILHVRGDLVDAGRLAHQLAVFQTSSPSYLFLSSMDGCVRQIADEPSLFDDWAAAIDRFDAAVSDLRRLRIPFHDGRFTKDGAVFAYDRSKIWICTTGTSMTGASLAAALRVRGIEPEMITADGVLCMTGMGDTEKTLLRLAEALLEIDAGCRAGEYDPLPPLPAGLPTLTVLPETALELPWESVPLADAVGRVSAEYVWAYPPGIPLLIPGETITEDFTRYAAASASRVELHGTRGGMPREIAVLRGKSEENPAFFARMLDIFLRMVYNTTNCKSIYI